MKKKQVKERATFSCILRGPPPFPPRFSIAEWSVRGEAKKGAERLLRTWLL